MKSVILIFHFIVFVYSLFSQTTLDTIPLHEYKFSSEINTALASGEMRTPKAAQYFSYIGEDQKALSVPNEIDLEWGFDTLTAEDKAYFKQFTPVNAVKGILDRAAEEQIIIINEAHHKPRHRVFVRKLLKGLYENGYRYFGLETLSNCAYVPAPYCDTLLNERGYPYNSPLSGTYVTDPQMSNLIKEAIEIGFEIFAYEKFGKERELNQAQYIAEVLKNDPQAKILIHCGWYHLLEEKNRGRKWMAQYLREMTGIDPLTVYQDILIERHCRPESPFMSMMNFEEEKIFVNAEGELYNGKKDFNRFDVLVYLPRTKYIFNRPDWLVGHEGNRIYPVENIKIAFPCMIKAFAIPFDKASTPVDIIEKEYEQDQTVLVLPEGRYRLVMTNLKGEKEVREVIVE